MTTLMADLVAQQQKGEEPGQHITEKAKQLLAEILLPKQITGKLIEKYIRKAMRTGAWRKLAPQTKALLYIAKRFPRLRSQFIRELLQQILTNIELQTIRGKALYYGILSVVRHNVNFLKQTSNIDFDITNNNIITNLLLIGINYLNNPLIFKL